MAQILVLTGHPRRDSLCAALAARYAFGARAAGHEVRTAALADLPIDLVAPDYHAPSADQPAWIAAVQADIAWCDHWVIVAPLWWGGVPAALKALIDRTLLPGFAFRYRPQGLGWDKLLTGRSARVMLTMDTPPWVLRWLWGWPIVRQFRTQILGFCGFAPVGVTLFGPVKTSDAAKRAQWLDQAEALGRRDVGSSGAAPRSPAATFS